MKKLLGLLLLSLNAYAIDPTLHWKTLETDHFNIHFAEGQEALAYRVAITAESAHKQLAPVIYWQPQEKTEMVISDETDQPNGYAMPFPYSRSVLFMAPPDSANTLEDFDDWLNLLITHEYTHVLHLDKVRGAPESLRKVFGRNFLLFPNMFQPGWMTEGLATHLETDKQTGIGRGQSTLYNMMMRTEVVLGVKPVSQVNLPMRDWPMGTSHYLYGVYFYQYMAERYGEAGIHMLIENYSNNLLPFAINTNTYQLFGKNITEIWADYTKWLEARYLPQINALQEKNPVRGEKISDTGYFTGEVDALADGRVFYVREGAFEHAMLMMIDVKGNTQELAEVHSGARIDVDAVHGVLIAQPEVCSEYNVYYDLYRLQLDDSKIERLTECGRYRSAAWMPDGNIIAVRMEQGKSSLHMLGKDGKNISDLWQGDEHTIVGAPDVSAEGKQIVASVFRKNLGWNIELFDLETTNWLSLTRDEYIDMYPRFNTEGDVLFSSERDGEYNIYRLQRGSQQLIQLTREVSGAFRTAQVAANSPLYYVGYSGHGSDIYRLDHPEELALESLPQKIPAVIESNEIMAARTENIRDYSPWSTLKPVWWSPWLVVADDQSEFGFETAANDAVGIHTYTLALAYDTSNHWPVGHLFYSWRDRVLLGVMRETSVFQDDLGNFIAARQDDDMYALLHIPFIQMEYSWHVLMGGINSRTHIERIAPGWLAPADTQDQRLIAQVRFDNSQHYIRSISAADGRQVRLEAETSDVWKSDYTGEVYTLDWREFISLGQQNVLALRFVGGYGTEMPEPFRLGGENSTSNILNDLLMIGEPLIGQREYALRGYAEGLPELEGRRMRLASAEWRFPLMNVERGIMAPPIGLMQWYGSVFAENGAAWQYAPGKSYSSTGIELHADVNLFYGINVETRLGVAQGLDDQLGETRVYMSLGASF